MAQDSQAQALLRDLGSWFWRLVPANPILVRVVHAGGRRKLHLWIRVGYLLFLAPLVVISVLLMQAGESSLTDLAKNATRVFEWVSVLQLLMVSVLAPVFAAGAITQEKDSQTYDILLSTPLTNGQIVLGSLLSRLYFIFMLLASGIPLFCIMMVYGGVTGREIALSTALAASTALITGSAAIAISVMKIGTGRTVFTFYLAIALYLIVIYILGTWSGLAAPEAQPAPGQYARMSWLAAFHPFLALWVSLGHTPAPSFGAVAHHRFPGSYLLAYPQYCFMVMTILSSLALVTLSLLFVRRAAKVGEMTLVRRLTDRLHLSHHGGEQKRAPRRVWHNPISWREAVTGAAAGGGSLTRYLTLGVGLLAALVLLIFYAQGGMTTLEARAWVFGAVVVELLIVLFIATATAATSMTREKESNTLELLLSTPLTSRHIISGKIVGLVVAAGPMLVVPYLTILLFILFDLASGRAGGKAGAVVNWEALFTMPILFVAFTAFVCMVGLQNSIKNKKTLTAVFTSMGVVLVVFVLAGSCAFAIQTGDTPELAAALWPMTPLTASYIVIDPEKVLSDLGNTISTEALSTCRKISFIASLCSAAIYWFIGWIMLKSMVRNFEMIIRKQSA